MGGFPVTSITEYPFIVSIQIKPSQPKFHGSHFCGGSVISKHYVLTAAHCGIRFSASLLQVVVGRLDLTTWEGASVPYVTAPLREHAAFWGHIVLCWLRCRCQSLMHSRVSHTRLAMHRTNTETR